MDTLARTLESLAGPVLPPLASLPATRPDPSGPSPGRAPAARFFTAEMPSLPRPRAGGGRRRAGCTEARLHKARPGCEATPGRRGSLPAGWSETGKKLEGTGLPRRRGWGGSRAPVLGTPNLEPRTCGHALVVVYFHVTSHHFLAHQFRCTVAARPPSLIPRNPQFGTKSRVPPP